MGTRNLTMVLSKKKIKVAQYGQWDGYPTGQGKTIAKFLQRLNVEKFKEKIDNVVFADDKELQGLFDTLEQTGNIDKLPPEYRRDTAAEILTLINKGKAKQLRNDLDFAADSLFCEWAYLINLDNQTVEVYQGFNKNPLTKKDRFYKLDLKKNNVSDQYHPIKLVKKYKFEDFTAKEMKRLETQLGEENE